MHCFPCFGKSKSTDGEREPLLPKHAPGDELEQAAGSESSGVKRSTADKVVDVLAALNAGKLPTQKQLSYFLQVLLNSELLKDDKGKAIPGSIPMGEQGRKVLDDVKGLVQALLQFGLEKNDDDKLQDLYFQVKQIESIGPVEFAHKAGQAAADAATQGASEMQGQDIPIQDEIAFDSSTFLYAIRTLVEISISSPLFRVALYDLFFIVKGLVAHAAADVGHAALQVAKDVEHQIRNDDIISRATVGEPQLDASIDDVKNKGKKVVNRIENGGQKERNTIGEDIIDTTKDEMLGRVQQILARIQRDPASRSATRAIILIVRKYAEKIAEASEVAEEAIVGGAKKGKHALDEINQDDAPNYPPQPYGGPQGKKTFIDPTTDALLRDFKAMLQRVAKGHSLDGLLAAFGYVVQNLKAVPPTLGDEINKTIDKKMTHSATGSDLGSPPASPLVAQQPDQPALLLPGKVKGKKNKKARAREKRALEKQAESILTPSSSQEPLTPLEPSRPTGKPTINPLRTYFSRLGTYLDKAIDEPGWATSKEGATTLESLFDDGAELVNVVGEVMFEVCEAIVDDKSESSPNIDGHTKTKGSKEYESRRKFKKDLTTFMNEADAYVSAVEGDKTTMRLLNALDALGDDLSGLIFQGVKTGRRALGQNIVNMSGWTPWIGWAIPRILRMLPSGSIPIPSIEVKTGNMEGALHALFVQGLARGKADPVDASLVPDSIVLKEWTEVKIDMVDDADSRTGPTSSAASSHSSSEAGVQMTSRVKIHMDGIRVRIEDMGYYFKYTGDILGYEDEGLLSVDVGMGSPHDGLGADVEVELESDNSPFNTGADLPEIVVEDASDEPANLDFHTLVANGAAYGNARMSSAAASAPRIAEPLFRITDVQVAIRGLKFKIDKSRHWILNKVALQWLAGPVVARLVRHALEEKLRSALEVVSKGLGAVIQDSKQKGEARREIAWTASMLNRNRGLVDEEVVENGLAEVLNDWWSAILEVGPMVLGRDVAPKLEAQHEAGEEVDIDAENEIDITNKGVIYTTKSTTTEQPRGTPAMVYNSATGVTESVDLTVEAIGGHPRDEHQEEGHPRDEHQEETVIAVGDGAQLFPGKGGPYGATEQSDERSVMEQICYNTAHKASNGLQKGTEAIDNVEDRWTGRSKAEKCSKAKTWRSRAFDF